MPVPNAIPERYDSAPMAKVFKPLKNERFFEKVANSIQREILLGNLAPGERLPSETELAKQFNVGRSAVREALKVLELTGLLYVKRGHNGGTFVKPPDPADAFSAHTPIGVAVTGWEQLMEARKLIEVRTAELAASRADEEEVEGLLESLARMRDVTTTPARFIKEDVEFHLRIAEAARNEVFLSVVASLRTALKNETNDLIALDGAVDEILADHEVICGRIAGRDSAGAGKAMGRHLQHMEMQLTNTHQAVEA
jgi:GntR family transcriptional repressor for pyruvate dehydrogenase complex